MPKQYPLKIDTTFVETKPAGLAAKYLNSGEIQLRAGVELAIAYLFAPLGAATDGASRAQVEQLIAASRTQSETYFALALSRCQENFAGRGARKEAMPMVREAHDNTDAALNFDFDFEENIDIDEEIEP